MKNTDAIGRSPQWLSLSGAYLSLTEDRDQVLAVFFTFD
ncbi:hypothetical Protein YC6258_01513 [Gynuella sunshinyii YC6258]|uniref:Uncharacterized protein n=1 Tax=Gynuella sunshinyii YC6258 TaxID=1445510 RepID=A0A0C5VH45_9GAMM|nr:hypothetical Protein YC6258_01513 [Gynuella sunshinyii YC6258]